MARFTGVHYLGGLLLALFGLLVCGAIVGAGLVYALDALVGRGLILASTQAWIWWGVFVGMSVVVCIVGIRASRRAYQQGESYGTLTTYLAYAAPVLLAVGLGAGGAFGYRTMVDQEARMERQHGRDCEAVAELGDLSDLDRERCVRAARTCRDELRDSPCNREFNSPEEARECREFRRRQIEAIRQSGVDLPGPRELSTDSSTVNDPDEQSRRLCVLGRIGGGRRR